MVTFGIVQANFQKAAEGIPSGTTHWIHIEIKLPVIYPLEVVRSLKSVHTRVPFHTDNMVEIPIMLSAAHAAATVHPTHDPHLRAKKRTAQPPI